MKKQTYLKRLEKDCYCGEAFVHWSMTIEKRAIGWLNPEFHYRFREILTHTCFRYRIACLIYCLMPDHVHMLWHGLSERSNQLLAIPFFRKHTNEALARNGARWQLQAYDRVLRDDEIERMELEGIAEYIARNPERLGLVDIDRFGSYPYSGCLIPGYPDLRLFESDSWNRVWRAISYIKRTKWFSK